MLGFYRHGHGFVSIFSKFTKPLSFSFYLSLSLSLSLREFSRSTTSGVLRRNLATKFCGQFARSYRLARKWVSLLVSAWKKGLRRCLLRFTRLLTCSARDKVDVNLGWSRNFLSAFLEFAKAKMGNEWRITGFSIYEKIIIQGSFLGSWIFNASNAV